MNINAQNYEKSARRGASEYFVGDGDWAAASGGEVLGSWQWSTAMPEGGALNL